MKRNVNRNRYIYKKLLIVIFECTKKRAKKRNETQERGIQLQKEKLFPLHWRLES